MIESRRNLIEYKIKESKYPYLGESDGLIILFTEELTGIVIYSPDEKIWKVGKFHNDWSEIQFKYYMGSVILKNKE